AAAGAMRNLDPALVARRGLSAFFYQLISTDPQENRANRGHNRGQSGVRHHSDTRATDESTMSHSATLTSLANWGLPVEPHWRRCHGIQEVAAFCEEWAEKRR